MVTAIALIAVAVIVVNGIVLVSSHDNVTSIDSMVDKGQTADCIVVLGASVLPDKTLSDVLEDRVDTGIEAYFAGLAPVIVMTGDGREDNYNEPLAMKNYAISQGVPAKDIFCDPAGYRTYDSMWRVAHVYEAQSAIVVTQRYHIARALFSLEGMGVTAYGLACDTGAYDNQFWYDLREIPGRVKDFALTVGHQDPENPSEIIRP